MSDLPPARRRRVAPVVTDPMAPTATPPAAPARTEPPAPQAAPAPQQQTPGPISRPPSRRQEPTVQLGTRVRPESDRRLRELAASRGATIRQVIEDLVDEAWSREVSGPAARF